MTSTPRTIRTTRAARATRAMPARRLAEAALVLSLATGVAACGDGSPTSDAADQGAPGAAAPATAEPGDANAVVTDEIDIRGFNFTPPAARVKAGQAVTWTNRDAFDHTVTANDRSYDSGNLAEGQAFSHAYDRAGTYAYFCAIHNSMVGTVVVE